MSARRNALSVIDLAHDLAAVATSDGFDDTAHELLTTFLPADELIWARLDLVAGEAVVRGAAASDNDRRAAALVRYGDTHPGVCSYRDSPTARDPLRMSDVSTPNQWHSSALYNEVYRPLGHAYQLGLLTRMDSQGVGAGWTFTRTSSDFTDREVALARSIQPVLIALEVVTRSAQDTVRVVYRQREIVLLNHLAAGLTARAIGRRMGITERTVRKHLGAIYVVLECGDRLVAVQRARDLGLIDR